MQTKLARSWGSAGSRGQFAKFVVSAAIALTLLATSLPLPAGEYSPRGLYDADVLELENDLRVVLKPRAGARTVSIRLAVGIGANDFSCEAAETAHFLEHMLFTGTDDFDESELDSLIESHGGNWNARTGNEETVFEVDMFSGHADLGLGLLYEIMTDSRLAPEDVETTRAIIHREMGGRPGTLERWLFKRGVGKGAVRKALELLLSGETFACSGLATADGITREDILHAFKKFYVPGNMTLVVVGDFDREAMLALIEESFGRLEVRPIPPRERPVPNWDGGRTEVRGTFSPVLDTEANVALLFRTPGYTSPDYYALSVLTDYLWRRIYDEIRVNRGLAYAPDADYYPHRRYGLLAVGADVDIPDTDVAIAALDAEVDRVVQGKLDHEGFEETKRGLLLLEAQGYESNADIAEYYVDNLDELDRHGKFLDHAAAIEAVGPGDVLRVAKAHLQLDNAVVIRSVPTLTYNTLYSGMGAGSLFALLLLGNVCRRRGWLWSGWRRARRAAEA